MVDLDEEMQEPSQVQEKSKVYISLGWLISLIWETIKQVRRK